MNLEVDMYRDEMDEALRNYDRYVVCLKETPDQLFHSLHSLMVKAINAYETRPIGMKNGISLNKYVTVVLSESSDNYERPVCCIYFNLSSVYSKRIKGE